MSLLHETLERVQHELSAHERERFSPQLLARVQAAAEPQRAPAPQDRPG